MKFAVVSDLFAWWQEELQSLIPNRFKRAKETLDIQVDRRDGRTIFEVRASGNPKRQLQADSPEKLANLLRSHYRKNRGRTCLIFGSGRFVCREINSVRIPLSRVIAAALLDLQSNTPFRTDDVQIGFARTRPTRYFIFKRKELADVESALRRIHRYVDEVQVQTESTRHNIDYRVVDGRRIKPLSRRLTCWANGASSAVLFAGVMVAGLTEYHQVRTADIELTRSVEAAADRARETRKRHDAQGKLLDQMQSVRAEKSFSVSVVEVWEELSRITPDNTYLTDLQINNERLVVSGHSRSAATLINLLDSSFRFEEPEFRSPVVRAPGSDREKFTLEAKIAQGVRR